MLSQKNHVIAEPGQVRVRSFFRQATQAGMRMIENGRAKDDDLTAPYAALWAACGLSYFGVSGQRLGNKFLAYGIAKEQLAKEIAADKQAQSVTDRYKNQYDEDFGETLIESIGAAVAAWTVVAIDVVGTELIERKQKIAQHLKRYAEQSRPQ